MDEVVEQAGRASGKKQKKEKKEDFRSPAVAVDSVCRISVRRPG
ncbi:MAG: hypothetical protein SPF91_04850 [Clostridium sp.]|nr:hypothetical protein [Clostridium sp.]MDY5483508.1 hypothetical protein [Clostridium sp.]